MKVTYSHAAPVIRARICRAAIRVTAARSEREMANHMGHVFGLVEALRIMLVSGDVQRQVVPGIAEVEHLPPGAVTHARVLIGRDADLILGEESRNAE